MVQWMWLPVLLSPGTRLGPYEVLTAIGAGGMGEVYRARDTRLGRMVAIKVLPTDAAADPGRRRRFEQEAPSPPRSPGPSG
jgi:eukaryotic-like serine/threonine-protein kinase